MKNQEIRVLRKRLHLTQQQFADKLNWSKSYLSMIETGKRTVTKECITRIRKIFHLEGGVLPMEAKIDFLRIRFKINSPFKVIKKYFE